MPKTMNNTGHNCRLKIRGQADKVTCKRSGPYCNVCEWAPGAKRVGNLETLKAGPLAIENSRRNKLKDKLRIGGNNDTKFSRERQA